MGRPGFPGTAGAARTRGRAVRTSWVLAAANGQKMSVLFEVGKVGDSSVEE